MPSYQVGAKSDQGLKRTSNQDSAGVPAAALPARLIAQRGYLVAVADGVGGLVAGDVASQTAIRALHDAYYGLSHANDRDALRQAVLEANRAVWDAAQRMDLTGMASTLVAAVVREDRVTVAHVGDSRAYRIGPAAFQQLTTDHTLVAQLLATGALTAEEAAAHPQRHVITRTLGSHREVEPDLGAARLEPGDALLLCSDGITNQVPLQALAATVLGNPPQAAADQLVALANQAGGSDNATAVIVRPSGAAAAGRRYRVLPALRRLRHIGGLARVAAIAGATILLAIILALALRQSGGQPPPASGTTPEAVPAGVATQGQVPIENSITPLAPAIATMETKQRTICCSADRVTIEDGKVIWTVQRGENLGVIAANCRVSSAAIARENRLRDADHIEAGWKLTIPCPSQP